MSSIVMKHDCESEFQDALYGKGKRVFNGMKKPFHWKCTVCGGEVVISEEMEKVLKSRKPHFFKYS